MSECQLKATNGFIKFETVPAAMAAANIAWNENDPTAVLVWYDKIKDQDYFSNLLPYQIVNRIPDVNLICRKAPLVRILQNTSSCMSDFPQFLPQSFILPMQNAQFSQAVAKHQKKYIIKPDNGSLGNGIVILKPTDNFEPSTLLSIAQEYIESFLLNGTKFDLRVYCLVSSISPELEIFVYRDSIARFCSAKEDSNSVFGSITNTAVNRHNIQDLSAITKRIETVFSEIAAQGYNVDELWKRIDTIIALTVISISNFMTKAAHQKCPSYGLPRCFQILGFDILLDPQLNPWILEVNYRPSLEFDTEEEKKLKVKMLASAMKISAPFTSLQNAVNTHIGKWSDNTMRSFLDHHPEILKKIKKDKEAAIRESKFVKVFPTDSPQTKNFERIISALKVMPIKIASPYRIPDAADDATKQRLKTQVAVKPVITLPKRAKSPSKKKPPMRI